jgi:hypothetical protein
MSLPGLCSLITRRRIEEQQTSHKNTVVSDLQLNKRKKNTLGFELSLFEFEIQ